MHVLVISWGEHEFNLKIGVKIFCDAFHLLHVINIEELHEFFAKSYKSIKIN